MTTWREAEIERLANAVAAVPFDLPGAGGLRGRLTVAPAQGREIVRAVLKALREPGDELRRAACERYIDPRTPAPYVLTVMIDTLLSEDFAA